MYKLLFIFIFFVISSSSCADRKLYKTPSKIRTLSAENTNVLNSNYYKRLNP